MTRLIIAWGVLNLAAAFWTGWERGHWWHMTGFFEPHRGYAMYAASVLPLLAPRWLGGLAWIGLLASHTRAAQVGVLVGWAWAGGRRRLALAGVLGLLAVVGGQALKPPHAKNGDVDRVAIWKATVQTIVRHPEGVGTGQLYMGVNGAAFNKAHSDVLHLVAEQGIRNAFMVLAALAFLFYLLPAGTPEKAAVAALLSQSIIDNRLHHPACVGLLVAAFIAAALAKPASR